VRGKTKGRERGTEKREEDVLHYASYYVEDSNLEACEKRRRGGGCGWFLLKTRCTVEREKWEETSHSNGHSKRPGDGQRSKGRARKLMERHRLPQVGGKKP